MYYGAVQNWDKGEGVQKLENVVDVICTWTLMVVVHLMMVFDHFSILSPLPVKPPEAEFFTSCSDFSSGLLGQTFTSLVRVLALLFSADTVSWRGNRCCSIHSSTVHSSKYVDKTSLVLCNVLVSSKTNDYGSARARIYLAHLNCWTILRRAPDK